MKKGRVKMTGLFSEKKGVAYDATVVLDDTGKYVNYKLEFDQKKAGAKHVFTVHANKRDYIASKILSAVLASGIMMLVSTVEAVGFCLLSGIELGSIGGIAVFFVEKWMLSAPFAAAILFVSLLARNKGIGFLFACLLGTGGLVMGLSWALETLHIPYTSQILSWTIYGASTVPKLGFQLNDLLHVFAATVIWSVIYGALCIIVLRKKDNFNKCCKNS